MIGPLINMTRLSKTHFLILRAFPFVDGFGPDGFGHFFLFLFTGYSKGVKDINLKLGFM